uniref:Calcium-binding protein 4 n=1 Tax=Anthurium amnicola TaxID=1678845 RepID=A0A1D1Z929_9ARAE
MASGKGEAQSQCGGVAAAAVARGRAERKGQQQQQQVVVLDEAGISELVGNEEAFSSYVDHKFQELDRDRDGKLSVKELEPAVADIAAAIGLPAQGSSPDSDHIYSEVLNEFTHGKQEEVTKAKFKEVLSDILLGMAAGLKRDPIVILRIDGEDLEEFMGGLNFESEAISIFSQKESENVPLLKCTTLALEQLTVDHGMPPPSDSWVFDNIIQPALQSLSTHRLDQAVSQEIFLKEFKKVLDDIARRLKEHPVIVAHSENTFDGSDIKRLLSNNLELDKLLGVAWKDLPKDSNQKVSKEYLRVALDGVAPSSGLPPYGAINQVDAVMNEVFRILDADDGKLMHEEEFKKLMREILGTITLQLEGNPICISSNSVVHETFSSSSSLLPTSTSTVPQSE